MKQEYAEQVAARIIEQLQQGVAPWQKPWKPGELRLPYNPTTGQAYRGMNSMWLHMQGHGDPRWMTYNQANAAGAQVRKGAKGAHVVYWKTNEERKLQDENGRPVLDKRGKQQTVTVQLERPRSFTAVVFNGEQIDGLPSIEARPVAAEYERHERAERILQNSGARLHHEEGDRAFYRPRTDSIHLPERGQFPTVDAYYATAFHELGHWTGHPSRLHRELTHPFGSEGYAREELRAEIASLMLGERLDLGHDPSRHAAYVGSWVKALQEDPREIFRAASDAERISGFVMAFEQEQRLEQTTEHSATQPSAAPSRAVLHEQPEKPMPSRTYLAVPYAEKEEAKAQGAKWDKEAKAWYAKAGVDVATSGLARWSIDKPGVIQAAPPAPIEQQFLKALRDAGLDIKAAHDDKVHPVADGKIHRVPVVDDKAGATSGAYAFHRHDAMPGGFIQNYKTGQIVHWKPEGKTDAVSAEERARFAAAADLQRQARSAERAAEHQATAAAAAALWHEAPAATAENAYCKAKGIQNPAGLRVVPAAISAAAAAHGIRIAKTPAEAKELREEAPTNRVFKEGDLLVPGRDAGGKLWTLQSVNPHFKSFMKGGRKHGVFCATGPDGPGNSPLVLAEGYATADTVSRLLEGAPVIAAFDAGNLDAVAKSLREQYPSRLLLIAADNDHQAQAENKPNVGLQKAMEVAQKYGGGVMAPQFMPGARGSDWNDVAAMGGDEAARKMLAEQMAIATRDAAITADRLTTLARERDMEARNDPTTSADDAKLALERGRAAETMAGAQSQLGEVRGLAADGKLGNEKGKRSIGAVKAGLDRKTGAMHDKAKLERQEVQNSGLDQASEISWKKLPLDVRQAKEDLVRSGRAVSLPKDAPIALRKAAGLDVISGRSQGYDADL
ncbi:zincin-like metallopeptidase domain-containing protein [Comamonas endophytica]|uniref:Zincin-like metallopeptidase domain-containing protein n=1 Tax=Comamonas endophytica TaxID=2949090 RepID=A0ABY6GH32_9BURK|nr:MULTISPECIES: zincin-like metallopeptidase domain-containing protein [unclassified Acidovorax]MCD2514642.1 ssDNA-binding domain-containing protein [Acidovorax sp. D4N7]UYG53955.1 zincin-like metallopeptidase domain-containing protein [Acidovorax sp. 5MLIR]